mgnify:CR=1 FL=1
MLAQFSITASFIADVIVHRKGRGERRENNYKGKNPHNFSVYSLTTSAISVFSAVS